MSRIIVIAAVGVALLAQSSSVLRAADTEEFTGAYYCEGVDASGTAYRGTTLIGKEGEVYYVQWMLAGHLTAVGVGIAQGDNLAVSYYGPSTGVVLYTRTDAGLAGKWTQPGGEPATFSETLTRIPDDELRKGLPTPANPPGPTAVPRRPAPGRPA